MKKYIFFAFWFLLLFLALVTTVRVTPLIVIFKYPATLISFLQRFIGLIAFTLFFVEIVMGVFMSKLINKFGGWIFNFHIFQGSLIYCLVFLHLIFFVLFNYFVGLKIDPYYTFIDVCLLCKSATEYYYTLGRVSFWFLTISVFAAAFRAVNPWFRANWRTMHVLNYIVFLIVGLHGFLIGLDFRIQPFFTFAIIAYSIVTGIIFFIEIPRLYVNFRNWLKN